MKFLKYLPVLLMGGFTLAGACTRSPQTQATAPGPQALETLPAARPREAWVLRSVLDQKPRMLSIALHENLWVAYNTQTGALYKAWTGGIDFNGPVYGQGAGQPQTVGDALLEEPDANPWRIISNGKEETPEVVYQGHTFINNQVWLTYKLICQGKAIEVKECPEYLGQEGGRLGFERTFHTGRVPAGVQVALKMQFGSGPGKTEMETNGEFIAAGRKAETAADKSLLPVSGTLLLAGNQATEFSVRLQARPVVPHVQEPLNPEQEALALMAGSDCNTCHNRDLKTVGPAYVAIAERYANTRENHQALVRKVLQGGAGNWGDTPMTPHTELPEADAARMVAFILSLDAGREAKAVAEELMPAPGFKIAFKPMMPVAINPQAENPGIALNVYQFSSAVSTFPDLPAEMLPLASGAVNAIHENDAGFRGLKNNFAWHATGLLHVKKGGKIIFRLVCDDGARFFIRGKQVIYNGGNHPLEAKDAAITLAAGKHPFRLEYYQGSHGKGLSLQWRLPGTQSFTVVPPSAFTFKGRDIKSTQAAPIDLKKRAVPGDAFPLEAVHPSFTLSPARPDHFRPKVGGMDFLPDGRMVVSTWDSLGAVYLVDARRAASPGDITVKKIAFGLAEPLGLKVVDGAIYVMQKQELTRLTDLNQDDIIDRYETVCNGWRVSANFHEFAFGLAYRDGYFYGTLATAINPGGKSTHPQVADRGKVVRINPTDGSFTFVASGLRTPNGIGFGVDNELFIADNQGDWLPASKIVHLQRDAWYGSRSVDFEGTANRKETLPVVWLTQDDIGNSPSQPVKLDIGPYRNQMLHGEVTHGGIKRVFAEKVNGAYQGAVFRFSQGLEAGVNRLVWGPDGALYVGGIGAGGNWEHPGKLGYGLQKMTFNHTPTFEMLAVRALPAGLEIEFTQALGQGIGTQASDYQVRQWRFEPTADYGGPKQEEESLAIKRVQVSADRKKVLLALPGMKARHVVYLRLNRKTMTSQEGGRLWATEAWYTLNNIPREK